MNMRFSYIPVAVIPGCIRHLHVVFIPSVPPAIPTEWMSAASASSTFSSLPSSGCLQWALPVSLLPGMVGLIHDGPNEACTDGKIQVRA